MRAMMPTTPLTARPPRTMRSGAVGLAATGSLTPVVATVAMLASSFVVVSFPAMIIR